MVHHVLYLFRYSFPVTCLILRKGKRAPHVFWHGGRMTEWRIDCCLVLNLKQETIAFQAVVGVSQRLADHVEPQPGHLEAMRADREARCVRGVEGFVVLREPSVELVRL